MERDLLLYLHDIRERVAFLRSLPSEYARSDVDTNYFLRATIERDFITIGEALNRICQMDESVVQRVTDFRNIVDFRNILVHGYFLIDSEVLWATIQDDLQLLASEIDQYITELEAN